MERIECISQYIYPDNEQQRAEFVQYYRAKSALKRRLLHELLPNLTDSQIALLVHEHTIRTAKRSIALNHRLRFLREFLYHTRLESLIRHIKGFAKKHSLSKQHVQFAGSEPLRLDAKAINKIRKTAVQIAQEYNRAIKSPRPNHAAEHAIAVESQAS